MKRDFSSIKNALSKESKRYRTKKLSNEAKKHILDSILPQKEIHTRFHWLAYSASFAILLAIFIPFVMRSSPGDILYSVKRFAEDVRSTIDPSFDKKLLETRENEKEEIQSENINRTDSDKKLDIIDNEIKEIQKRIESSSSDNDGVDSSVDSIKDVEPRTLESNASDDSQNDNSASNSSGSNNSGSNTTKTISAKDACKQALDARKKAGEDIDSDLYKACDNL